HNCKFRRGFEGRLGIAGQCDCLSAFASREFNRRNGERRASAGGDSDHNVFFARLSLANFSLAEFSRVLVGFDRPRQCTLAPSHYELHHARRNIEGWGTFGGIKGRNSSTSPGTDIDQTPATPE